MLKHSTDSLRLKSLESKLIIANEKLAFLISEKTKSSARVTIANKRNSSRNKKKEKKTAELVLTNKELILMNHEKVKYAAELLIANEALRQFAYIASHDLQEPLRTVSNYMKVFEEDYIGQLDDNAHLYISAVNKATKRMSELIKSLLGFARIGYNKKLSLVNCTNLISDVIADLGTLIKKTNATIEVQEMPELPVYEIEIRQLFQNLITNAIKFHKQGVKPEILIAAAKIKGTWTFSVSDNGIGIVPANFERVFDIFQRLQTSEIYEGNGIGLANCKKIVQLHEGKIWIESKSGEGTTFYFTLPELIPNEKEIKLHNAG